MGKASLGNRYEMDMTSGPLFSKIMLFSMPLIFSGILQLIFNAADIIVVGRFAGEDALAAVGATSMLISLLVNMFMGFSIGTDVVTAQAMGAKDKNMVSEAVHTSVLFSLLCGVFLAVVGCFFTKPLLFAMNTPLEILDKAALYIKIYFLGMPIIMLYNFCYAIMRAMGDTKRPMRYLIIAGVVNVILNIIFVTQFNMDVAGVAIATVISQVVSAVLMVVCLTKLDNECRLELKKLKMNRRVIVRILRMGIPAGIQNVLCSATCVVIQTAVNYFGKSAIAGNAAAGSIMGFVYISMLAFQQTATSFVSQNYGAGEYKRIKKVLIRCILSVTIVGIVLGYIVLFFAEEFLSIYSDSSEAIGYGTKALFYVCSAYFICGIMDTIAGVTRGLGRAVMPVLITLVWVCLFTVVWIYTIFEAHKTFDVLFQSYPVSWILTVISQLVYFAWVYRKLTKTAERT